MAETVSLAQQVRILHSEFPALVVTNYSPLTLKGPLNINVRRNNDQYNNQVAVNYNIEIIIPEDYPSSLPEVYETEQKLNKDYGHINPDGSLCLAVRLEMHRIFLKAPSLIGFMHNLVIPFFYSYKIWEDTGKFPFGESAHGVAGVLQYYEELFGSSDLLNLKIGMCLISRLGYRGHYKCLCGSGKNIRDCHQDEILMITKPELIDVLLDDYETLFKKKSYKKRVKLPLVDSSKVIRMEHHSSNFEYYTNPTFAWPESPRLPLFYNRIGWF